jgi:hypothetical protein
MELIFITNFPVMLSDTTILLFVIVVNLIALAMTYLAWKHIHIGRFLFGGMFLGAGIFNLFYAFSDPEEYVYYADFAIFEAYRRFILGIFSEHVEMLLTLIGVAQVIVGIGFWSHGRFLEISALAGAVFLLAIVPLGFGAAFPAPVIMTIGAYLIYRQGADFNLTAIWQKRLN